MDYYHNEMMQKVFSFFCRDEIFNKLYEEWPMDGGSTENHVPDVFFPFLEKVRHSKRALKKGKGFFPLFGKVIYDNTYRRYLLDVIDSFVEYDSVIFHQEQDPYYFGCSCQHFLSREFLSAFVEKIEKYDLYETLDLPFAGSSLESIWGWLPAWLGYEKWFFDGIHRVRKNFVEYTREDDPDDMCRYLNAYFKNKIKVEPEGEFIKIRKVNRSFGYIRDVLGETFF